MDGILKSAHVTHEEPDTKGLDVSKMPEENKKRLISFAEWWEQYQVIRSGGYI